MRTCRRLVGGRCWAPNLATFLTIFIILFDPFVFNYLHLLCQTYEVNTLNLSNLNILINEVKSQSLTYFRH